MIMVNLANIETYIIVRAYLVGYVVKASQKYRMTYVLLIRVDLQWYILIFSYRWVR